ncbi:MAG TPA: chromosome segregation protein SMC [Candidatus Thiothrix moscowensis]|uniref:chromosome segregation protein SMC n=1 Tax=unclassified Thiothrix TaxID=2636184 RepID=UPI0025D18612|nr:MULTISPECIES: chromosome segregation protein SMC [unclassified Thiothrix]HRJ53701.1 chromosome segregation protein SMC [Candidatus Thiothrix moscowensis]HRJ93783.1 chromosome segregation protein SMC [Candidatus Thiothrix moscowensis]
MRLSKIRIAGFKSFVDPVTLEFRNNLTGILGPNGCGKSNTIDAVRWVMGETSAKNLRGSSMEDVIFNGSSSRKPVGLASVELVFDNSDGKIGGEYAQYAEISVKRQVSRDGDSRYFLNGSKCRRRDITDIFLGTGLGPRSYAIIEQGMISRLIEAKPEELRNTLEEAAGISRYKERRRETETRMAHTRENLERLTDLREEVDKQLERLDKQAKAAQRFRELREEERKLEASVLLLQWQALKTDGEQRLRDLSQRSNDYQAQIARLRHLEAIIEEFRNHYTDANETLNAVQGEYYQAGSDIARIEQNIRHQRDIQRRQQEALRNAEQSLEETLRHAAEDREKLQQAEQTLADLEPREDELNEQVSLTEERLFAAEDQLNDWQEQWHAIQQRVAEPTRQAQVEKARMEQIERQLQQTTQRLERLQQETANLSTSRFVEDIQLSAAQLEEAKASHAIAEQQLADLSTTLAQQQQEQRDTQAQLDMQRSRRQSLQGRLASLETLQQSGLDKANKARSQWLQANGLDNHPRLAEQLRVESGWETAVETVLGDDLDAVMVKNPSPLAPHPAPCRVVPQRERGTEIFPKAGVTLLATESNTLPPSPLEGEGLGEGNTGKPGASTLASKVRSPVSVTNLLTNIRCVDTLAEALAQRHTLAPGESIITRAGLWLGSNWLRSRRQSDAHSGILQRQQEIEHLREQLATLEATLADMQERADSLRDSIRHLEQQRQQAQAETNRLHRAESEQRSRLHTLQQRIDQLHSRQQQVQSEHEELDTQRMQQEEDLLIATENRNVALEMLEEAQHERDQLAATREELQQAVAEARRAQRDCQDEIHDLRLELETSRQQREHSLRQLERISSRLELLEQQRDALLEQIHMQEDPAADQQAELEDALERRAAVELRLTEARQHVQAQESAIRQHDHERILTERQAEQTRTDMETRKLEWQAIQVREQTIAEQFAKTEFDAVALQTELAGNVPLASLQQQLETIQRSIQRLGAINLAAIDEFHEQSERKQYLDQQNDDLVAALETLETAIRKIDRETRARFKDTFDLVNGRLRDMFPRLFGGGECYLEMTGEDLLTTGVAIMARPPGKRISTIYLMSGGEKALTAVALVFAIFELNPAPFCMLDEVDAPLDEANVGRFCELVRHMSERVQFIFITHNKTTMELADNLIGVTMREAGVSRLVTVDVAEAVKLANG